MIDKKLNICVCLLVIVGFFIQGCRQGDSPKTYDGDVARSALERDFSPQVAQSDLLQFVRDNNAFAFDLYHALKDTPGNLLYSPYSISIALAMTYAGARNRTETQIADTLHFVFPQDQLHNLFNALDLDLNSRGGNASNAEEKRLTLNIVNAVWGQKDYPFLDAYLDVLAVCYGAGIRLVNFMSDPESVRLLINSWVAQQTADRIKELLEEGDIDSATRLVLTNAIYFKAAWEAPFDEELTKEDDFFLLDGTTVSVPMMVKPLGSGSLPAAEGPGYKAVQLPYYDGDFAMLIVVPDRSGFQAFEQTMDAQRIEGIVNQLEMQPIALRMPKFGYESAYHLEEEDKLPGMGMPDAFTGLADFTGIDGGYGALFISKVIHQTFISVDEAGTEAAAATAVVIGEIAMPEFMDININRPFIYLIRDTTTGTILFVGRVLDPTQ